MVISLSAKLAMVLSRSAASGLSPLFGIRSDIDAAAQDLDILRAFLRFADSSHGTDTLAAAWIRQVRDAAFELEDVADECCYLSGGSWVNVGAWFALSRRLRKARERLSQLSAAKEQYGIRPADGGPAPPVATTTSQILTDGTHFLNKGEVVGFADYEKQLLEWLAEDVEPQLTLVAVWGMGGVGKTTLVTRVHKEVVATKRFHCAAWVTVSKGFTTDVDDLLRKILQELHHDDAAASGYRSLVAAVRGHLRERKYLVVLDDVWEAHLWDKLRHAFPDDATGSRVVITTRSSDVAMAAAPERTMALQPLPWREAWNLFCNVAFRNLNGRTRTCPSHLEELAADMLRPCCGLPLAIVSVGNLLAHKDRTEFAWRNIRDSLVWDKSCSHLEIGEAASMLNLSIDDLPHHLKRCFLSCSTYPEDFLIKRKILIRMWVAQGFVEERPLGQCTAEDVADDYLDQLVQRSLLQAVVRNEFGRAKSCIIHDLMRELIVHKLLTVLNLWFIDINKLPDSVTNLYNLRYLGIRSSLVQQLPKELGKLQKLQTLDAKSSMVERLPSSTAKLKNLRHLILFTREAADFSVPLPGKAVQLPDGIEKLSSLQTLKYVRADNKMVRSLAELEQMRSL
ncbi:unnamed protein product [Urochloa decumbens]|uniref:Uncharacterized protein n=1 Tax=Urochloa decumbens TaxID=240449 RepID=A0ABC9FR73_9POAL